MKFSKANKNVHHMDLISMSNCAAQQRVINREMGLTGIDSVPKNDSNCVDPIFGVRCHFLVLEEACGQTG